MAKPILLAKFNFASILVIMHNGLPHLVGYIVEHILYDNVSLLNNCVSLSCKLIVFRRYLAECDYRVNNKQRYKNVVGSRGFFLIVKYS